ncbi:uncharacterized protein LOC120785001 [Xiphias gladius]|uniref:uncharacterized protein LOC120785001 n=1 Tax=Xiphias gladius TaxID=8245 RepID=UPI001A9A28AA|nr:uncharacterized protein LOC120785001 [Xiphias gladius]XP_039975162.1 uncharacterized protein LOC120785001 [Xiphias gladius]XP_039975163.1 uncharacterized protein LOC120785001 [Xiphias gladius]
MVIREIFLYLLLGQLFIAGVISACVPVQCLRCNVTGGTLDPCQPCLNIMCINDRVYANMSSNCKKAFQVSITSTGSDANEGDDITLTCVHDLPKLNLTLEWKKDEEEIKQNHNESKLALTRVRRSHAGQYICYVNSSCGNYESLPHKVTVNDNSEVILVICGVSAFAVVLIMALAMKIKLRRDNAKHRERMEQRAQGGKIGGPAPFMPRES